MNYLTEISGIPEDVVNAWIEVAASPEPTNPLAVPYVGSDDPIQQGSTPDNLARYYSVDDCYRDVWSILQSPLYAEVRFAIRTEDSLTIAEAIERSPFRQDHYAGKLVELVRQGLRPDPVRIETWVEPKPANAGAVVDDTTA
jgi:hypothetical protein